MKLDVKQQELIAIGVSFALNCHSCLAYHKQAGLKAGLNEEGLRAALAVAESVREGAHQKTQEYTRELLGECVEGSGCCPAGSACCG